MIVGLDLLQDKAKAKFEQTYGKIERIIQVNSTFFCIGVDGKRILYNLDLEEVDINDV